MMAETRKYSTFKAMPAALYSTKVYADAVLRWNSFQATLYLFWLTAIMSLVSTIVICLSVYNLLSDINIEKTILQIPGFVLRDGQFYVMTPKKYTIVDTSQQTLYLYKRNNLERSDVTTTFNHIPTLKILFTPSHYYSIDTSATISTHTYPKLPFWININERQIQYVYKHYYDIIIYAIPVLIYIILLIFAFISYIIIALFVGLLSLAVRYFLSINKATVKYANLYALSAVSITWVAAIDILDVLMPSLLSGISPPGVVFAFALITGILYRLKSKINS